MTHENERRRLQGGIWVVEQRSFVCVPATNGAVVGTRYDPVPVWSVDEGGDTNPLCG